MIKIFLTGLIIGALLSAVCFWYTPRVVHNTHIEVSTDTLRIRGEETIDTTKETASGQASVAKQPTKDSCTAPIDSVINIPPGGFIKLSSEDVVRHPLTVEWYFPQITTITKERVDTFKIFEMRTVTVEVEMEAPWYGSPLAHAVYGAGLIALFFAAK